MQATESKATIDRLIRPFRRFWWTALLVFIGIVGMVIFLTFQAQPIYEAKGTLYIRPTGGLEGDLFQPQAIPRDSRYLIKNQIPILKSRSLAAEVIRRLEALPQKDSLWTLGYRPPPKKGVLGFLSGFRVKSEGLDAFQDRVERFRESARVIENAETHILELRTRALTPDEAALLVNVWIDAYLDFDLLNTRGDVGQTRDFLERKLRDVEDKLNRSEAALAQFQKENKVVALTEETQELVSQLSRFESLYEQTRTDREAVQRQIAYLKDRLDASRKNLVEDMAKRSSPVIQELQTQMARLIGEKAAYEAQLVGAGLDPVRDSRLIQIENRIEGIRERIVEETKRLAQAGTAGLDPLAYSESLIHQILELEVQLKSLDARTEAFKQIVDEYTARFKALPDKSLQLARLEREVRLNRETYMMLAKRYEEVRIREASEMANIRVIDRGEPPKTPVSPRKRLNVALAVFFGLFFGLVLAFVRDYFDQTILSPEDLHAKEISLLGVIPFVHAKPPRGGKPLKHPLYRRARRILPHLLTYHPADLSVEEHYRSIRTLIQHHLGHIKARTVLVTSPAPGEGKTVTTVNLAVSFAKAGVHTLLVDCDLRQPILDVLLTSAQRKTGLTVFLDQEIRWHAFVIPTTQSHLDLMPSGPPVRNAPELLGSDRMRRLLSDLKHHYGLILFDTPPLFSVPDALILSGLVDGVLLIARAGLTQREAVTTAIERLREIKAPFLGTLLLGVSHKRLTASYGE